MSDVVKSPHLPRGGHVNGGRVIPFPISRDRRAEPRRLRARHHALVADLLETELQAEEMGFVEEAADLSLMAERAADSLREFEQRVARVRL